MVVEANPRHRVQSRRAPIASEDVLDAAGYLGTNILLADLEGVALDAADALKHFPELERFQPADPSVSGAAIRSSLFATDSETRLIPRHRSIAEYLSARWLAKQLQHRQLTWTRLRHLMTGDGRRTVAGLRGLYGWLATCTHTVRKQLIEADPVTVYLYGDPAAMNTDDRRRLLHSLISESANHPHLIVDLHHSASRTGMWDPNLEEDFHGFLTSDDRSESARVATTFVADILATEPCSARLAKALERVLRGPSHWPRTRILALTAWMQATSVADQQALLHDIIADDALDPEGELASDLLEMLYPQHASPEQIITLLIRIASHQSRVVGRLLYFYSHLPDAAPPSHLPALLDALTEVPDELFSPRRAHSELWRVVDRLLLKAFTESANAISAEQAYRWLGIGLEEIGSRPERSKETLSAIQAWIEQAPSRYLELLKHALSDRQTEDRLLSSWFRKRVRLAGIAPPQNTVDWHLAEAGTTPDDAIADLHLHCAIECLTTHAIISPLVMDKLHDWRQHHPDKAHVLAERLICHVSEIRQTLASKDRSWRQEEADRRRERTRSLATHLDDIRKGSASPALMYELAGVWHGLYGDIRGQSEAERFDAYVENGQQMRIAAEAGFRAIVLRDGLPSPDDILSLYAKQKEFLVARACLTGMDLLWQSDPSTVSGLSAIQIEQMVLFRLTTGTGNTPPWFWHVALQHPEAFSSIYGRFAQRVYKRRDSHLPFLYELENDRRLAMVARHACPQLLRTFPLRARKGLFNYLSGALKGCLAHNPNALRALVQERLNNPHLEPVQRTYWLTAGAALDPDRYQADLLDHISRSQPRREIAISFLTDRWGSVLPGTSWSPTIIGYLLQRLIPLASFEQRDGFLTPEVRRGRQVEGLLAKLSSIPTDKAAAEFDHLLSLKLSAAAEARIRHARFQQSLKQREHDFQFPGLEDVIAVIRHQSPTSVADLAAIALDCLDDIENRLRNDNDDGIRGFWNIARGKPSTPRDENLCRDLLMTRMRSYLDHLGISVNPEVDRANDKRTDILVTYGNAFEVPIELKPSWNRKLWSAAREQLMQRYATAYRSNGYGIYLVLWFGVEHQTPATDGGKRPRTPDDLSDRLSALLSIEERQRITVKVLDLTLPKPRS